MVTIFRSLPSVDRVITDRRVQRLMDRYSRQAVLGLVRSQLEEARDAARDGSQIAPFNELVETIEERAASWWRPGPGPVINATGVILHTNLGRSPLSQEAADAIQNVAANYSHLELDLDSGARGSRQAHIARLLCQLTGAEAAFVSNNNASAVLLALTAIASGKEVIVSRGEAVEIGGGFRIPDVLRQSGAILVEVGTTNRTYVRDYENAITERTGAILSVHASNFRILGFTHSPDIAELAELGTKFNVPVVHDLGSGCLLDTRQFGLTYEPMPQESIGAGVSLGLFSCDKLMGGPQAGVIVGRRDLVDAVSRHPLARAMRIDKLSMAALAATLLHYVIGEAAQKVPIWRMVSASTDDLATTANRWRDTIGSRGTVRAGLSTVGGGSLPGETLPTWLLGIDTEGIEGGADALAKRLRQGAPPVVSRIEDDRVLLDPRTVLPEEEPPLLEALARAMGDGIDQ